MGTTSVISLVCLIITTGLASMGIFSRYFDDSLVQRVGLSCVAIACIFRIIDTLREPYYVSPEVLMTQIGITVFGLGTAVKLSRRRVTDKCGRFGHPVPERRSL